MITLKPSLAIRRLQPQINFHTLGLVCSLISSKNDTVTIRILNDRKSQYVQFKNGYKHPPLIMMSHTFANKTEEDRRYFLKHFFHEFRHYIQDKVFGIDFFDHKMFSDFKDSGPGLKKHLDSAIEVDARNFEKTIGYRAVNLYYILEKKRRLFKLLGDFQGTNLK